MRHFIVLVTVVVLMTAMMAFPAVARPILDPCQNEPTGKCRPGTPLPTVVCAVTAEDSGGLIGWRNGTCWVFHPVPVVSF